MLLRTPDQAVLSMQAPTLCQRSNDESDSHGHDPQEFKRELYDTEAAPCTLKVRMLKKAKVMETLLFGCVT